MDFDENCRKVKESRQRQGVDRKKSGKMRPGNQYALCFGAQLNGRGSLLAIFFDWRLLGFFSLVPWGVTGWFCGPVESPSETNAATAYGHCLSFSAATRRGFHKNRTHHILLSYSLSLCSPYTEALLVSGEKIISNGVQLHCPLVGNDFLRTSVRHSDAIQTRNTTCSAYTHDAFDKISSKY